MWLIVLDFDWFHIAFLRCTDFESVLNLHLNQTKPEISGELWKAVSSVKLEQCLNSKI